MTIRWVPTISPATWPPAAAGLTVHLRRLTARASAKGERARSGSRRSRATPPNCAAAGSWGFPVIVTRLAGTAGRLCTALDCADVGFISGSALDHRPATARLGAAVPDYWPAYPAPGSDATQGLDSRQPVVAASGNALAGGTDAVMPVVAVVDQVAAASPAIDEEQERPAEGLQARRGLG